VCGLETSRMRSRPALGLSATAKKNYYKLITFVIINIKLYNILIRIILYVTYNNYQYINSIFNKLIYYVN
jgi:hypothetical protein